MNIDRTLGDVRFIHVAYNSSVVLEYAAVPFAYASLPMSKRWIMNNEAFYLVLIAALQRYLLEGATGTEEDMDQLLPIY